MPIQVRHIQRVDWGIAGEGGVNRPPCGVAGVWRWIAPVLRCRCIHIVQQILLADRNLRLRRVEMPACNPTLIWRHRRIVSQECVGHRIPFRIDNVDLIPHLGPKRHQLVRSEETYLRYLAMNTLKFDDVLRPKVKHCSPVRCLYRSPQVGRDATVGALSPHSSG